MKLDWILMRSITAIGGLGVLAVEDMVRKEVSLITIAAMAAAGTLFSVMGGAWTDTSVLFQFIPGLLSLILAKISDERIGYGDGWVLLCLGCYLAIDELLGLCVISLTCVGAAALFMLLILHRGRRAQIPFVPFLLIGYVVIRITT